jgi:hypothetical protein
MNTNTQSSFWSRTYSVRNRSVKINFYFGETKLSEFKAVVDEAGRELAKLGLTLSADSTFLSTNRAGMFLSCWFSYRTDEVGLQSLIEKLEEQEWKAASD